MSSLVRSSWYGALLIALALDFRPGPGMGEPRWSRGGQEGIDEVVPVEC